MRTFMASGLLLAVVLQTPVSGQVLTGPTSSATPPAPVSLTTTGLFQERFSQVGNDVFVAGQPTERGLRELRDRGVTTIVNLRTPEEMARVGFDEAELVRSLGMRYIYLPMRGNKEYPYAPQALAEFIAAMKSTEGKLLLHCTIAWRASHLWAAYLIQGRGVPDATALEHTRAINLMDDHRVDENGQPLELFLGRPVPGLGHPR